MTDVIAVPARDVGVDDFADLVPGVAVVGITWAGGGALRVSFDGDLTDAQVAAVRRRMVTADAVEEQLRAETEAFLDGPPDATLLQLQQQVERLTRLLLGRN